MEYAPYKSIDQRRKEIIEDRKRYYHVPKVYFGQEHRENANHWLDCLQEKIERDGFCLVKDYLSYSASWDVIDQDFEYGWRSIKGARIGRDRDTNSYYIEMPEPELIEKEELK